MYTLLDYILFSLLFLIPAGVANSTPAIAAKIPGLKNLDYPIDFGKTFGGKPIFGSHKTFRGFIVGISLAIVASYLSRYWYNSSEFIREVSFIDYNEYRPWLLGLLFGFGALGGDAIKSFFKRRTNIKSGDAWFPFDQIDFLLGVFITVSFYVSLDIYFYLVTIILWPLLHISATIIGYFLGIKDKPI